jgi:hypothetical protein
MNKHAKEEDQIYFDVASGRFWSAETTRFGQDSPDTDGQAEQAGSTSDVSL